MPSRPTGMRPAFGSTMNSPLSGTLSIRGARDPNSRSRPSNTDAGSTTWESQE